jgi:trehalose 6-phosphate phosphatase
LFLDVDGTLIEFTDTPSDTVVDADLKALLAALTRRLEGAVALVSGRNLAQLDTLFAPLKLPAAGLHGVERRKASGDLRGASYVDTQLDEARVALGRFVESHPGLLLEDKERSLAVHFRLAPELDWSVRRTVSTITKSMGSHYHVQEGNMVFEIKPYGFTKGTAVNEFMREPPFSGRRPVFVGDDLTDASAIEAVEVLGGISVAVGDRIHAQWRLDGPRAVRRWLKSIVSLDQAPRA